MPRIVLPLLVLLAAASLNDCGGGDTGAGARQGKRAADAAAAQSGEDFGHVHGLGINPKDGALFIATHTGLFRAPRGSASAARVGTSHQDVMGFTVVGRDRFLGSGHPDPDAGGPPNLGLIRTVTAGRAWRDVSLTGKADFHVLRAAGPVVYGFNGLTGKLMASRDGGRSWAERQPPAAMFDLAISPENDRRVVASTEAGLFSSPDGGVGWRALDARRAGLLTWTPGGLYLVGADGGVSVSADSGRTWRERGSIGGQPAAFESDGTRLYAAKADGTVVRSSDGGATWSVRTRA